MRRPLIFLVSLITVAQVLTIAGGSAIAAGRGEGGCVIDPKAPVVANSNDQKPIAEDLSAIASLGLPCWERA